MSERASIDFTLGSRRLLAVEKRLATWSFGLEDALAPNLAPAPEPGPDGLRVLSAPTDRLAEIIARFPCHVAGGRQDYRRHFIDMGMGYEDYLARFSAKTRSTLRRKAKKLAKQPGGYRVSAYSRPAGIESFLDAALPLSAKTYQARLLDAGLPESVEARRAMLEAAEDGRMRCFLLSLDEEPIAYLSLPVMGDTLVYAHLGYDPDHARLSPGSVLQMEALERLFAEERFRYFDFTEGEGAHKALFGTDAVQCTSLVLLEPTIANRALIGARTGFDAAIGGAKAIAARTGALSRARALLRA